MFFPEPEVSPIIFKCKPIWRYCGSTGDKSAEEQECQNEEFHDYNFKTVLLPFTKTVYIGRGFMKKDE